MNQTLNKYLTISETHLNSIYLNHLNDSCDRALSYLDTARSVETHISRISTLSGTINK